MEYIVIVLRHMNQEEIVAGTDMRNVFLRLQPGFNTAADHGNQLIPGFPSKDPVEYSKAFDLHADQGVFLRIIPADFFITCFYPLLIF